MSITNKTFDVKNGLSVANTIVLSNTSGVLNVSNINTLTITQNASFANIVVTQNCNVSNMSATGNVVANNLVITTFVNIGNLSATGTITAQNLTATANLATGGAYITYNIGIGGNDNTAQTTVIFANGNVAQSFANIFGTMNVTANIANVGNLSVTQNTVTGNLSVTTLANSATLNISANAFVQNVWVNQNVQMANAATLFFGGNGANAGNALYSIAYNVTATSLDFVFI